MTVFIDEQQNSQWKIKNLEPYEHEEQQPFRINKHRKYFTNLNDFSS